VEHRTKNESKKYYKSIQDVTQEFKPRVGASRDANGKILTEKRTFRENGRIFGSVLTADLDDTDSMIFFTAENEDIQPSYEEVTHVIKCLKTTSLQEQNKYYQNTFKKGGETLWRRIHRLIKLIWVQHKISEE
jgi:hypothetical protein